MARIGTSDLDVMPLCLGGNVFGWTADEHEARQVLDAYAGAGGNFVDTADMYGDGTSEAILGRWLAGRSDRHRIVVATKVGMREGHEGLAGPNVRRAAEGSLDRLGVEAIDLYYAHRDDPDTPLEETLAAFDELVREGKVRYVGASNYSAPRLAEALAVSDREGFARYVALQPHYNLMERHGYEGDLSGLCARERIGCIPYFGLARGFLTGKYRPGAEVDSARARGASAYLDARGKRVLAVLDEVAAAHGTPVAAVALAWLSGRPAVVAPIASARTPAQLADLLPAVGLSLTAEEVAALEAASAPA